MLSKEEIGACLWGPHSGGSERRASILIAMLKAATSDAEFWRIFQLGWSELDDIWGWRKPFKQLLKERPPAALYLEGADKAFYDELPELITVHRGGSCFKVRGLAWTTDLSVAESFARGHRGITVPYAAIATAKVPKEAIYTVSMQRQEFEIVLNWRRLRGFEFAKYVSKSKNEVATESKGLIGAL